MSNPAPHTPQPENRKAITLSIIAIGLFWAAMYLFVPTLSVYAKTKTDDLALVGVVVAQYGLWQALVRLPLGITADWLGRRKPFILAGCVLAILGTWLMGISGDINGLIVGRAVTGLAAGAWVAMTVSFSNLFRPEEAVKATALVTLVNSVSRMVATLLTGPLNDLGGYSLSFLLAAGVGVVALIAFWLVKEPRLARKDPSPQKIARLVTRRDVLVPALLSAVGQYAAYAATYGFIPIRAQQLGAGNVMQSILTTLNLGVTILGNLLTNMLLKRLGTRLLIYIGFAILACGLLVAALAVELWMVFAASILNGLSFGIIYPLCMGLSIEKVQGAERTTAMGLHQAVYAIGMFTGPWISGILANRFGIPLMFGITGFIVLALGWVGLGILYRKPQPQPAN